jgi:hypothetical protein
METQPDPNEFPNFDNVDSSTIADIPESYSGMNAKFNEEVNDDNGDE